MIADRCADFYQYVFELKPVNRESSAPGHHLTDGRVTLSILPWSIPLFENMSIKRPGPDHIGFKVENIDAFKQHVETTTAGMNPYARPMRLGGMGKDRMPARRSWRRRPAASCRWPIRAASGST